MSERHATDKQTDQPGPETAENDTEGHSYFNAELGRQVMRDHAREAAEYERKNALSRAARPRKSIRDRLFGR